jgi:hypothetical protein
MQLFATMETEHRTPQSGDALILADGRRFIIDAAEAGLRGWWFTAQAQDRSCMVQGNLPLEWDGGASAWRPAGAATSSAQPRSMQRSARTRFKQAD